MKNKQIEMTARQGNRIFFLETFCAVALFLPQMMERENSNSGIVSVFIGCLLLGIYSYLVAFISRGVTMEQVLGKYPLFALIYYIRFFINASFFYSYILYMVNRYLLPGRSAIFAGIPLLVLAFYMNQGNLLGRGKVLEGIFWFILVPVVIVYGLAMGDLAFEQLEVTTFHPKEIGNGSLSFLALMHPIELLWFYRGHIKKGGIKVRYYFGLCVMLIGMFIVVVGSLGRKLVIIDENPVMSMAQGVAVPGGIMARLDIFLVAFFVVGLFCVVCAYLFYGNESLRQGLPKAHTMGKIISYGGLILLAGPVMNLHKICMRYFHWFVYGNLTIGFFLPIFLFIAWKVGENYEK